MTKYSPSLDLHSEIDQINHLESIGWSKKYQIT